MNLKNMYLIKDNINFAGHVRFAYNIRFVLYYILH